MSGRHPLNASTLTELGPAYFADRAAANLLRHPADPLYGPRCVELLTASHDVAALALSVGERAAALVLRHELAGSALAKATEKLLVLQDDSGLDTWASACARQIDSSVAGLPYRMDLPLTAQCSDAVQELAELLGATGLARARLGCPTTRPKAAAQLRPRSNAPSFGSGPQELVVIGHLLHRASIDAVRELRARRETGELPRVVWMHGADSDHRVSISAGSVAEATRRLAPDFFWEAIQALGKNPWAVEDVALRHAVRGLPIDPDRLEQLVGDPDTVAAASNDVWQLAACGIPPRWPVFTVGVRVFIGLDSIDDAIRAAGRGPTP